MALFLVEKTFFAVVEAKDEDEAGNARFRLSEWEPDTDVHPLRWSHQIPRDWHDYPPIDVKGRDHGTEPLSKLVPHEPEHR